MRKPIVSFLILVAVITFAVVLASRAQVFRQERVDPMPASAEQPSGKLVYAVEHENRKPTLWFYDLASSVTTAVGSGYEGAVKIRFNQNSNLCESAYPTAGLSFQCDFDDDNALTLTVSDEQDGGRELQRAVVEPFSSGAGASPAAEGYLVPVAVADDKSAVYLGRRVETESWVAGLWKLDLATGKVSEVTYVREHNLYQYEINPATDELFGVTFVPPESLGADATGPTSMFFVDLKSGVGVEGDYAAQDFLFENPMLSDDGTKYAVFESGPWVGGKHTTILTKADGRVSGGWEIDGIAKDWFGDTLVFDRDGNLFLYDLKTKSETQITHETEATVEYFGVVR